MASQPLASSFRDPSGFLYRRGGVLYRQVNRSYQPHYDRLIASGLCAQLVSEGLLIPHEESDAAPLDAASAYRVLRPEPVPFISYPYEWCFSQLRDAALTTLAIQRRALRAGLSLKDASAYNIQFHQGRPVLIDTLSFEERVPGRPWVAYRQFCQHFLAPLALMAYRDVRCGQLLRTQIDGIPLDLAARLLPWRTRLMPALLMHLHAHAASQRRYAGRAVDTRRRSMSDRALQGLVESLAAAVRRLRWEPRGTEWADYYNDTNYTPPALADKRARIAEFVARCDPGIVWDLGANNGYFSRAASERGILTIASDVDPAAVELNYRTVRREREDHLLPLLCDLTNPSPALGWSHTERESLLERGPADLVLALALVHHLAISNNVPLPALAEFFARAGRRVAIEFVPKEDSQVQRLLATRADVFPNYHREGFEAAFRNRFTIEATAPVQESQRLLYLMRRREEA